MGRRVLRRHIWGYSVCLCPIKGTPGLNELRKVEEQYYSCSENKFAVNAATLICAFVFVHAKCSFSHDAAELELWVEMRPSQGVWGFREKGYLFLGIWGEGHLFSGILGESITFWDFREQGAEEKHFRELGRKVIFLSGSREQRPTHPRWGGGARNVNVSLMKLRQQGSNLPLRLPFTPESCNDLRYDIEWNFPLFLRIKFQSLVKSE